MKASKPAKSKPAAAGAKGTTTASSQGRRNEGVPASKYYSNQHNFCRVFSGWGEFYRSEAV